MTNNQQVLKFVQESAELCQPRNIVWITGEEAQLEELRKEAMATGELIKLNEKELLKYPYIPTHLRHYRGDLTNIRPPDAVRYYKLENTGE